MKKISYPIIPAGAEYKNNWKSILVSFIIFVCEFFIFYWFLKGTISIYLLILFHLIAIGLLGLLVYISARKMEDLTYPLLLLSATAGMGPIGALGFLLFSISRPLLSLFATPFSEWFQDLFPMHENIFTNVFQRIEAGWDDYSNAFEMISFQDFFLYGTLLQKQAVLDQIVANFNPSYAPLLKNALEDPSNVIRIQAAAILAKIEHDFELKTNELTKRYSPQKPRTILDFAHLYDYYAFLNILTPMREIETQKKALDYYQQYLQLVPEDAQTHIFVGRLLNRMKDDQAVVKWFENFKKNFPDLYIEMYPWYLEALYDLEEFKKLSGVIKEELPQLREANFPNELTTVFEAWAHAKY